MYGFSGDFQGIETNGNEGKAQAALCGMSKGNAGSAVLGGPDAFEKTKAFMEILA